MEIGLKIMLYGFVFVFLLSISTNILDKLDVSIDYVMYCGMGIGIISVFIMFIALILTFIK